MTFISNIRTQSNMDLDHYQNAFKGIKGSLNLTCSIAEAALDFNFKNESLDDDLELNFIFALAMDAVILGVDLMLNGSRMTGRILKTKRAEDRYEQAISDGDSPILVEPLPGNHFRLQLGNLTPQEQATVTIRYAQQLIPKSGEYRFVLPTTIAQRYGATRNATGLPLQPKHDAFVSYPLSLQVKWDPLTMRALSCPSLNHVMNDICFLGAYDEGFSEDEDPSEPAEFGYSGVMNSDYVLTWKLLSPNSLH